MVNSTGMPQLPARRNGLAFVSVLLCLVFPFGVVCELLGGGVIARNLVTYTGLWSVLGGGLVLVGLPATILAVVVGHVALRRANRRPFQMPLRGVARTGLVLGYSLLLAYIGLAGLVLWVAVHGIHIHDMY